jgi:REP element-mobilizing transposase RayT
MRPHVWNLRTGRCYERIAAAIRALAGRADARVVHFSVQGNHLHLLAEADGALALGRAMRVLSIRLSRSLNALMRTRGRVLEGRYHAHVLRTPSETRRALAYVTGNFVSHAARRGQPLPADYVDPFSSAAAIGPDGLPPPVSRSRTWLLEAAEAAAAARLIPPAGEEVAPYAAAA